MLISASSNRATSPWLFPVSVATLLAAFPLIFMGGLVTTHQAGMAVPDWPNSYGYNMWLFPPSQWIGGIFYEHTHRLLGTLVGLLAIATVMCAWGPSRNAGARKAWGWFAVASLVLTAITGISGWMIKAPTEPAADAHSLAAMLPHLAMGFVSLALIAGLAWVFRHRERRQWVRWLSAAVLGMVCVQGILGGLRVDLVNIHLAVVHGVLAQLVLCSIALMCLVTSRWWAGAPELANGVDGEPGRRTARVAYLVFGLVFCQLVVGAMMRHYKAGLAIPGVLTYGHVLPPTDEPGVAAANASRAASGEMLPPVTLAQIWLHFGHRIGACVVAAGILTLVGLTLKRSRGVKLLAGLAWTLAALLAVQVTLGVLTVYYRKPADITTLHHSVGATVLMVTFLLGAVASRVYGRLRPVHEELGERVPAPLEGATASM